MWLTDIGVWMSSAMKARARTGRLRKSYDEQGSSIDKWDHYIDIYDDLFKAFTQQPVRVLEIGVMHGGSLRMWRRFFHRRSLIVGLDIDARCKAYEQDNIKIEIGDQADKTVMGHLKKEYQFFDIVIDDGGHAWDQQIKTFEELYDITRSIYVVEDTHTSYWAKYGRPNAPTFLDFAKNRIDLLHEYFTRAGTPDAFGPPSPRYPDVSRFRRETRSMEVFDSMVVFKKGRSPAPFRSRLLKRESAAGECNEFH